jgi:hypothetical protein
VVAIRSHRTIAAIVARVGCMGLTDRHAHLVNAEPVTISIAVGEQAALQHLVGGGTDAWHEVRGVEGRLLNFGEMIFEISIQNDSTDCVWLNSSGIPSSSVAFSAIHRA